MDRHIESIHRATDFFQPIAMEQADATSDEGLISFMVTEESVSHRTQKALDLQKRLLVDLAGVGNAYVRKQANERHEPNLVYDVELWQEVYNNLPLMGPSSFERQTFSERVGGIKVATAFIKTILGFAVSQGAALVEFSSFLGELGKSIEAGIKSTKKTYSVGSIAIVLTTERLGNETVVDGYLKGYFIDFSLKEHKVYTSCASGESFQMDFSYRNANSLFNVGALKDKKVRKDFMDFLHGTQIDDIKRAQHFFGGKFDRKTTHRHG